MLHQLAAWIAQAIIAQLIRWAFGLGRRLLRRLRQRHTLQR
ncbi:MAG: hypothetical protein AB7F99_19630 [Vicinamibacterales bacterium]